MERIRQVLVAVDFSPCAEAAVRYAAFLGRCVDFDNLALLHVVTESSPRDLDATEALQEVWRPAARPTGVEERALARMRDLAARFMLEHPDLRLLCERGDPVGVIQKTVERGGYDLLLLGRHGRHGTAGLGRVTKALLAAAPCPVVPVWSTGNVAQPSADVARDARLAQLALQRHRAEAEDREVEARHWTPLRFERPQGLLRQAVDACIARSFQQ